MIVTFDNYFLIATFVYFELCTQNGESEKKNGVWGRGSETSREKNYLEKTNSHICVLLAYFQYDIIGSLVDKFSIYVY